MIICADWLCRAFAIGLVLGVAACPANVQAQNHASIEIVPIAAHSLPVYSVAFSPDGRQVISGSWDKTVKLWETDTGRLIRNFTGHTKSVSSVAVSPDGARLLSGSWDMTMKLWEAGSGRLIQTFQSHVDGINSVAFSPSGSRVLSGSFDKTMKLWDVDTGRLEQTFAGHTSSVMSVAFSSDGKRVLSGSQDKTMKLWDASSGRLIRTFKGHSESVDSVAFSPDGTRVLSGSKDKTMRLWDASSGRLIRTFKGFSKRVSSVAFSPNGARVLSGSYDNTLKLWDSNTGRLVRAFEGQPSSILSVAFSTDGSQVLTGNWNETLGLLETESGRMIRIFDGHSSNINSVAFSPDGSRLLSGSDDKTLKLWDAGSGRLIRSFNGHSESVGSVAFSPDGTQVLSGSYDNTMRLWKASDGQLLQTFEGHSDGVISVAFSPDGTQVVSGSQDGTLKLWEVATGRLLRTIEERSGWVYSVAFSPDGTKVLSGQDGNTMKLWEASSGRLLRTFEGHSHSVTSVAFSPDGSVVLSGSWDKTVRLWETDTGRLLRRLNGHSDSVSSVAFSTDGERLISGSWDKTVKVWDTISGRLIQTFQGHLGDVSSVAFLPHGSLVASGSLDGATRIWDAGNKATASNSHDALLATLIGGRGPDQWITIVPAGFFGGTRKGNDILSIVRLLETSGVEQIHQSLFSPDLVREALLGDPDGEVRKAAEITSLEKVIDSGPAPKVTLLPHRPGSQSETDVVTLQAQVRDQGKGIGRIEWRVNGITVGVSNTPAGAGQLMTVKQTLALDPGENTIEVVAYNSRNLVASQPAETEITWTGTAGAAKPKLHVLAIGINAYQDTGFKDPATGRAIKFKPLGLAVKDAETFGALIKAAAKGPYESVDVTIALDADASAAGLEQIVGEVAAKVSPRDTFILYAASHGYSIGGRFYLIPQDYQSEGADLAQSLARHAIGQDRLQDWLVNRIKAKKALVLLDTCASGALVADYSVSRADLPASEAAIGRLHEATGRPVLTAAAGGKEALEGFGEPGQKHGVFTYAVMEAFAKGDTNGNGMIELSELAEYVQKRVPEISPTILLKGREPVTQKPKLGSRGEDFVVVGRLP